MQWRVSSCRHVCAPKFSAAAGMAAAMPTARPAAVIAAADAAWARGDGTAAAAGCGKE